MSWFSFPLTGLLSLVLFEPEKEREMGAVGVVVELRDVKVGPLTKFKKLNLY